MPNYCSNDLIVEGDKKEVQAFFKAVRTKDATIDANKILPYPKRFADADKKSKAWRKRNPNKPWSESPNDGYNNGGYQWCVENWGTKWGLFKFSKVIFENNYKPPQVDAKVTFDTAWSPPVPIIEKASRMFPKLTFSLYYYECGCQFHGVFKVKNGRIIEKSTAKYLGTRGG